jgi:hypothetical protein
MLTGLLLMGLPSRSQETTATLGGTIQDPSGSPVNGASIVLVHLPTGSTVTAQSNTKGLFNVTNLRPGGPYTIKVSYSGLAPQSFENVQLSLGNNPDLAVSLKKDEKSLTEVVVTGSRKLNNANLTVNRNQMASLPSINRSLSDFTRLTPQSNNNSFAGSNFRYNNFTLDGAINNDAIGFSNSFGGVSGGGQSGTAGAGTRTNPYSIESIQEIQVQLAPYDVKIGNFTGGSVNAVTKSGTNQMHGSIYGFGRNGSMVGKSVDGTRTAIGSDFHDYQTGFSLGGAIVKNKLFFFVNGELTRRQEPTFYNAGDPGAAVTIAQAQSVQSFLKNKYGYDVGTYDRYKISTKSDKIFSRLDWNINSKNTLMLRAIYTSGQGNNLERSNTNFQFSSTDFTQYTKNLNLVAELRSKISSSVSNNLILSYINVHEYRDFPGVLSPFMDIGSGQIWAGTWREASIYNMKQKTIELSDNVTITKGIHKITLGTHNEFYDLSYGFINSWNGRWEYSNLTNFLADKPSRIRGAFTTDPKIPNDRDYIFNNAPHPYKVSLLSAYGQDEVALSKRFKLTAGLRLDYSHLNEQPATDPQVALTPNYVSQNPTFTHTPFNQLTNKWLGTPTVSPRIGFNFDVKGDQSLVLRGGTGIFVGRMPFAWLGYAYTLNGTTYGNIDYKPGGKTVGLAIDPQNLRDTVTKYGGTSASATHEVNLIDNNFKLPRIWRSNIAADIRMGKGYKLTLDAMYTKTLYDVLFQQINIKDTAAYYSSGPSQSPVYVGGKLNSNFSNAYLLSNTKEGMRYNLTAQLSKQGANLENKAKGVSLNWSAAYTYGVSKDMSNGIRNSFQSNYELNPSIVSNSPVLAYSNFDLRHRIVATVGLGRKWNEKNTTSFSLFYSNQSGSPYSFIYAASGAPFGNASNANLPYIPKTSTDIKLADVKDAAGNVTYSAAQQWTDLDAFISKDSYLKTRRGQYAERNGGRTPWNQTMDLRIMHEIRLSKGNKSHALQLSLDIFNVLNLLNNDWGHIAFVTNTNNYTANLLTFVKDAAGKSPGAPSTGYSPTFTYNKPSTGHYYTIDPISSRWQMQVGIHYAF